MTGSTNMIDTITGTAGEPLSFEEALQKIRDIVTALESGDLTLEESMTKYQEGSQLIDQCRTTIDEAEMRITELTREDEAED
jgi:exodeoxyribonuclease VII small subunit